MITLEDIELLPDDTIAIHFSYEGNQINIERATMCMSKKEWIACKQLGIQDEDMIQRLWEKELQYMIEWLDD